MENPIGLISALPWYDNVVCMYRQDCGDEVSYLNAGRKLRPTLYHVKKLLKCWIAIFGDDIFKFIFLNENCCIFIEISLKCVPQGSIKNKPELVKINYTMVKINHTIIGSDNGLSLNRRQAIIWTNDGKVYWRIYASHGLSELMSFLATAILHFWRIFTYCDLK